MANLFTKSKKVAPVKDKAKDEKIHLLVEGTEFFDKIESLERLKENIKRDTARADMISDEVREISKEKWIEQYEKTGKNPESVMVEAKKGLDVGQVMFLPSDKYISINAERAEELTGKYGSEIVEEKTTFSFDNVMVEKYGDVISRLIEESDEISDEDKAKIIKASVVFTVAKGTIDKLNEYGEVSEIMDEVRPVVSLKNVEIIKG